MSQLIGKNARCKDQPEEIGLIIYYNAENGDIGLKYPTGELLTHISRCRITAL